MTACDDVLAALFLGDALDAEARAHLAACPRCRATEADVRRVAAALAADTPPAPPPGLAARTLRAATPLLERHARRDVWREIARAVAVALVPLPPILLLDAWGLRAARALLGTVLPDPLAVYVVLNHAVVLALLLAVTYGSIPILVDRQLRLRRQESHG